MLSIRSVRMREDVQAPEEFKDEPENESEPGNGGFRFLRPGDGLIAAFLCR